MERAAAVKDRIWQEFQIAEGLRKSLETRSILKHFLLVAVVIVLCLAAVALLGGVRPEPSSL